MVPPRPARYITQLRSKPHASWGVAGCWIAGLDAGSRSTIWPESGLL
jgi:hypothetical protein